VGGLAWLVEHFGVIVGRQFPVLVGMLRARVRKVSSTIREVIGSVGQMEV
jgi:hypothetical protein